MNTVDKEMSITRPLQLDILSIVVRSLRYRQCRRRLLRVVCLVARRIGPEVQ
jgi:hypothetical protein